MFFVKNVSRHVFRLILMLLMVFTLGSATSVQAASFKISGKTVTLSVSESKDLKIDGLTNKSKVKWSSSDKSIASVNQQGRVVAKAPGCTKIKAVVTTKAIKTKGCASKVVLHTNLKVRQPKLNAAKKVLDYDESFFLRLKYSDAKRFSSSDEKVVVVDDGGLVKAVGAGAAVVTCEDVYGNTYTCHVRVSPCEHKWSGGAKQIAPDCERDGRTIYVCGICGYEDVTVIPALGHNYEVTVVEPSKQGQGYMQYDCNRCDDLMKENVTDYNPSEQEVHDNIAKLYNEFYEGRYWTNNDSYVWKGGLFENNTGYGCVAIGMIFSDDSFGYLPARIIYDFDDIRVGDIIRMDNDTHSVIVIDRDGDYVTVAEGNYESAIHWGRKFSIEKNSNNWDYVITRYPELLDAA